MSTCSTVEPVSSAARWSREVGERTGVGSCLAPGGVSPGSRGRAARCRGRRAAGGRVVAATSSSSRRRGRSASESTSADGTRSLNMRTPWLLHGREAVGGEEPRTADSSNGAVRVVVAPAAVAGRSRMAWGPGRTGPRGPVPARRAGAVRRPARGCRRERARQHLGQRGVRVVDDLEGAVQADGGRRSARFRRRRARRRCRCRPARGGCAARCRSRPPGAEEARASGLGSTTVTSWPAAASGTVVPPVPPPRSRKAERAGELGAAAAARGCREPRWKAPCAARAGRRAAVSATPSDTVVSSGGVTWSGAPGDHPSVRSCRGWRATAARGQARPGPGTTTGDAPRPERGSTPGGRMSA